MNFSEAMIAVLDHENVRLPMWAPNTFLFLGVGPLHHNIESSSVIWCKQPSQKSIAWVPSKPEVRSEDWEFYQPDEDTFHV